MKKVLDLNLNVIGSILLAGIIAGIILLFISSNGNYIAHPQF